MKVDRKSFKDLLNLPDWVSLRDSSFASLDELLLPKFKAFLTDHMMETRVERIMLLLLLLLRVPLLLLLLLEVVYLLLLGLAFLLSLVLLPPLPLELGMLLIWLLLQWTLSSLLQMFLAPSQLLASLIADRTEFD